MEWTGNKQPLEIYLICKVGFPGGRQNKGETDRETAERETLEEICVDLKSEDFQYLGALDDRTVTHWMSDDLTLVLSGFVYLHLRPGIFQVKVDRKEVAAVFSIPLEGLLYAMRHREHSYNFAIPIPIFRYSTSIWKTYLGTLYYPAIEVAFNDNQFAGYPSHEWRVWGITLRLTSDLLDLMMLNEDKNRYESLTNFQVRWNWFWRDVDWLLNLVLFRPSDTLGHR